jgi:hypothetical protein
MHGGEAQKSADKYSRLSDDKQQQLREFLLSLVAPYPGRVYAGSTRRE